MSNNQAIADHLLTTPRPFCDWHEDRGDVLWWRIPIREAPYLGSPLDCGRKVKTRLYNALGIQTGEVIEHLGGWPFATNEQRNLWWTPLPDAKRIEDQVPL